MFVKVIEYFRILVEVKVCIIGDNSFPFFFVEIGGTICEHEDMFSYCTLIEEAIRDYIDPHSLNLPSDQPFSLPSSLASDSLVA